MTDRRILVRPSRRAKRLSMTVRPDGTAIVSVPWWAAARHVDRFVSESMAWLERQRERLRGLEDRFFLPRGRKSYLARKEAARAFVADRLRALNARYGFRFGRVAIKDLRRNWGSCSEKGNLNFNYKIIFLPARLADYVIVHELCHLARFDHSTAFWALVERAVPDHRSLRRELQRYHA